MFNLNSVAFTCDVTRREPGDLLEKMLHLRLDHFSSAQVLIDALRALGRFENKGQ